MPLEFDLRGYLDRRSQDPAVKSWIETVRRTTFCRLPAELRSADSEPCSIETVDLPSPGDVDESLLRLGLNEGLLEPSLEMPSSARAWELLKLHDLKRLYLATGGPELVLYQTRQDAVDANHTALTLHADFNGPIRFRLYRLATLAAWQELGAAGLTRLKPQRTWSQTFQPLECNNSDPEDWPVPLDNLGEGYYLLTAEARYAPMLAACKFCVNHLAVYLRRAGSGRDRGGGPPRRPARGRSAVASAHQRQARRKPALPALQARRQGGVPPRLPRRKGRGTLRQRPRGGRPAVAGQRFLPPRCRSRRGGEMR